MEEDAAVTNEQILEMKRMIRDVKKNPSLILEKFDLPRGTLHQPEVSKKNDYDITDQDVRDMKSFVHASKLNPSLIYQQFDFDLSRRITNVNDPFSPNCVTQVAQQISRDQLPEPPLSDPTGPGTKKISSNKQRIRK